jgi:ABC-type uncharacterized transport system involved in gliding motility auxiliary subunit
MANPSNKRALSFGLNSAFLILVTIGLLGVINFVGKQYPKKIDTTKNKLHTFSDQSEKVMKGLKSELKATLYGDLGTREKHRLLIETYKKLSSQFKFELVDPNKEPTRAKAAGIKKMETLVLEYQGKVNKLEELSEEKITNAIIKLTKDGKQIVCAITGHGEKSVTDQGPEGYAAVKKGLEDQAYEVKEINLLQEAKLPEDCSSLMILGSTKAFFANEIKMIHDYLSAGGRAVIGVESVVGQPDQSKEIVGLLKDWGVVVKTGLVVDPDARRLQVDASMPIVSQFNPDQTITKQFAQGCVFPLSRPLDQGPPPAPNLKVEWLAKTSPKAWGETDLNSVIKGAVQINPGVDLMGPITLGVAVSGKKDDKATRETRLAVFGSSQFANNQFSRFGGNIDLMLNSISWTLEDESLISIRAKEDEAGKVELTQGEGTIIAIISVLAVPLIIAIAGIVIWVRRKKL